MQAQSRRLPGTPPAHGGTDRHNQLCIQTKRAFGGFLWDDQSDAERLAAARAFFTPWWVIDTPAALILSEIARSDAPSARSLRICFNAARLVGLPSIIRLLEAKMADLVAA